MNTADLLQRLDEMLPAIRARREQIEQDRRLPRDLVDQLREVGVFALEVPRAIGGAEATPIDVLRVIESVSRADASTGWCVALGSANNGVAGFMHEAGAREVFADPTAPVAGIFAPAGAAVRVDGGVRVSGRWGFASGITHSDWVWGGCMVMENGKPRMTAMGPEIIHAFMPTRSIEIADTWHVSGLCGTGSNDVIANDVLIPDAHTFHVGPAPELLALHRMPPLGWFASHIAGVSLGVARGALDELIALAQTKVPTFSMAVLADRPAAQIDLAKAEASLEAARSFLHSSVESVWQTLTAGGQPTPRQVALHRIANVNATEVGATVTRTASMLAGGSSILKTGSLQRHMRDAEAAAHHFCVATHVWEDAGRVFMGRTPQAPMF